MWPDLDDRGHLVGYVNDRQPNNWGRWGPDDELGTVNFITPAMVTEAAGSVRDGRAVSCAIPIQEVMPVNPARPAVVHTFMYTGVDFAGPDAHKEFNGFQGSDDHISMPLQSSTHWDGLAHVAHDDAMYNGFWAGNVAAYSGARRCGTHLLKDRLAGRGVLLDIARHLGVDHLAPGHAITVDELDACAAAQDVEIGTGDILLLRTGEMPFFYGLPDKAEFWLAGSPGLAMETVDWIHHREIAALAVDNIAIEVVPARPYEGGYPMHARLIRDLGLTIGELWWLEELTEACEAANRWEFFLVAAPLHVTNAAGAPINPIAFL
ncbi:cyclase family protein [Nonomuraea cavernae]|uniref:Cyclase n=1 Tax=Nonomuraea cavernae TaxID=2045107 RepID=A0A917ZKT8_9ACTN|nr:cyclase family protein [Nonomuraea cavernae]MCA2190995.1 cyclase family protein [Nonomuraea cavernae]GGO83672.1 cyclase [Nonomuraea cavernae]